MQYLLPFRFEVSPSAISHVYSRFKIKMDTPGAIFMVLPFVYALMQKSHHPPRAIRPSS
jgi:hypothetical protein